MQKAPAYYTEAFGVIVLLNALTHPMVAHFSLETPEHFHKYSLYAPFLSVYFYIPL
jgi:hypothetical protein